MMFHDRAIQNLGADLDVAKEQLKKTTESTREDISRGQRAQMLLDSAKREVADLEASIEALKADSQRQMKSAEVE